MYCKWKPHDQNYIFADLQAKHAAAVEGSAASPIPGTDENQNHHKVVSGYVNSSFFAGIKLFWILLFFYNANVPKASTKGQLISKGNMDVFKFTKKNPKF